MLAAFLRTYQLDDPAVTAAVAPWAIASVAASAVRPAVEVVLTRPARARIVIAIEAQVDGVRHLAATRDLHLSYYAEDGVDHGEAALRVRALAAALARFEGATRVRLPLAPSTGHRFVELRINRACNERCRFCNTPADSPTILPDPAAIYAQIASAAAGGCTDLLLTGRETTLDPALPDYVAAARAAGIGNVRVQTNATTLGHGPILGALVAAGVTELEISLHTLDPDVFAALVGPAHLLGHALAGLDAVAGYPALGVTIVTVITSANATAVPALVDAIAARWPFVRTLVLSPVAPVGDGADALDLLVPFPELGPIVAAALRRASAHGLTATVPARCGLPPCVLPPDVRPRHDALRTERGAPMEPGKHKPPGCAGCALDRQCGGAWSRYLERHGPAGLRPL